MLEIRPAKDYSLYKNIIDSIDFSGDRLVCIAEAVDKDKVIGYGIYYFTDVSVVIKHVESYNDLYLYDGIVRSVLFMASNNGIDTAVIDLHDMSIVEKLHFVSVGEKCIKNIDNILSNCKTCRS